MKKKTLTVILAGSMALSMCSCGEEKTIGENEEGAVSTETKEEEKETEVSEADTEQTPTFSFEEFKGLQFYFSSGAGGWATMLTVDGDGSFSGEYFDGELGVTGEEYPNGTMYQSNFTGHFTEPVQVNDYTYSMQIRDIDYEEEVGTEEIADGMLYCYVDAYGLTEAKDMLLYAPGAPLADLPEDYRSWVGYYDHTSTEDTELPFWGMYNEAAQCGFSSYRLADQLKQRVAFAEEEVILIETSIKNDSLSQAELNEKSQQLYQIWDSELNAVWDVLKQTLDEEAMNALTLEEREWIAEKEAAVSEAGAEYEGGSLQPMVENQKAAELTKARVYELLELLEL